MPAAVASGARRAVACAELGLDARTLERWRAPGVIDDGRHGPRRTPKNKLTRAERARIVEVATNEEFRDMSPKQIVPRLADRGQYIGSESTLYRVLRSEELMAHRGRALAPRARSRPEHGFVKARSTTLNQRNEPVQVLVMTMLVRSRAGTERKEESR